MWSNHIVRGQTGVVERRLVSVDGGARRILDDNRLRYYVGDTTELAFIFSELCFCLLEGFDVGTCSVPPNNLATLVPQWLNPHEKPAKDSVMATETRFHFAGFTYDQEGLLFLRQWRSILGMDRSLPTPTVRLFGRQAGVLMPALVKELVRTIREIAPGQRGDRVDHLPKFSFRVL